MFKMIGGWFLFYYPRNRQILTLSFAILRHFERLALELRRGARLINVRNDSRVSPPRRALPACNFMKEGRAPRRDISALKRLIMGQRAPRLAIRNLLRSGFLRHRAQLPLLGKLPLDRRIPCNLQVFIPILPTVQVGRIRATPHVVRVESPVTLRGIRAELGLAKNRSPGAAAAAKNRSSAAKRL